MNTRAKNVFFLLGCSLLLVSGQVMAEVVNESVFDETNIDQSSTEELPSIPDNDQINPEHLSADHKSTDQASIEHECSRIAKKLSSVGYKECLKVNLQGSNSFSAKGAPILIKEYPPLESREPMGRVLLIGGTHGDEYSSVSVVFKWLNTLDKHHSGLFHWHVAPLMNPDGLLQKKSTRTNANGVDLNRNFPTRDWKEKSRHYWEVTTNKNPRRYPGEQPLSESESRWLYDEINEFKPDVIVSVHAPHGIVDYNHDGQTDAPDRLGRLHLNLLGTYPGSLGNFAGMQRRIPVLTIELKHAGIMPSTAEISDIWVDMVRWLQQNLPSTQPSEPVDLEKELRLAREDGKKDEAEVMENL